MDVIFCLIITGISRRIASLLRGLIKSSFQRRRIGFKAQLVANRED